MDAAIDAANSGDRQRIWSIRAAYDVVTGGKASGWISTLIHELGNQVHYWAGLPDVPAAAMSKSPLTLYSGYNRAEWHAEHSAAWFWNRAKLAEYNKEAVEYIDEMIRLATVRRGPKAGGEADSGK